MNKRTKRKLERFQLNLTKYVFNSRYIVRNILATTMIMTVVVMVMGITSIVKNNNQLENMEPNPAFLAMMQEITDEASAKAFEAFASNELQEDALDEVSVGENKPSITFAAAPRMDMGSIDVLMAVYDDELEADITEHEMQMVAESSSTYDGKFVVTADEVNLRDSASLNGQVLDTLYYGMEGAILGLEGDWYRVNFTGTVGYVKAEYVLTSFDAEDFVSENADAIYQAQLDRKDANKNTTEGSLEKPKTTEAAASATTQVVATEEAKTEVTTQATTQATTEATTAATTETTTEEATTESSNGQVTVGYSTRSAISLSESDINLMASIMTLECGAEPYEGQLAVANVILNRLESGYYGSTMSDVCYAPYQFSVATSPKLDYYLTNGAQASCLQAAREALAGTNNIGNYIAFRPTWNVNTATIGEYTIIGGHVFYMNYK